MHRDGEVRVLKLECTVQQDASIMIMIMMINYLTSITVTWAQLDKSVKTSHIINFRYNTHYNSLHFSQPYMFRS
jgi:hypothetical protein